jgi:Flp pilus assembly protein TadG
VNPFVISPSRRRLSEPRAWQRSGDGSTAVEFALILPVASLLLFGLFEFGRAFYTYNVASSSVRDAARFAARLPANCVTLTAPGDTLRVQKLARTGTVDGTTGLVAGWTDDNSVAVTLSCVANPLSAGTRPYMGRYGELDQVPVVQVTATIPYVPLAGSPLGISLTQIRATHRQVWTE